MTYLWMPSLPIEMVLRQDQPNHFLWQSRLHRVHFITRQWRVDMEWWRVRVWRDYYKLVTDSGLLVIVYCDLMMDSWYLQQLFD